MWEIPVHDSTRVRDARMAAREACDDSGLAPTRTAAAELVATELATNLLKHAAAAAWWSTCWPAADGTGGSVQLYSLDHGPGIADVDAALRDGYSTADGSLGAGLGSAGAAPTRSICTACPAGDGRGGPDRPRARRARGAPARLPAGGITVSSVRTRSAVTPGAGCAPGRC
ncbi:ATP-binding protein [Streptomyces nogalater]